jgi:hypothetical protein
VFVTNPTRPAACVTAVVSRRGLAAQEIKEGQKRGERDAALLRLRRKRSSRHDTSGLDGHGLIDVPIIARTNVNSPLFTGFL